MLSSKLNIFLRWLKRTETLEVIPNIEPLKMVDNSGLKFIFSGTVCIYQLCIPSLSNVQISASYDKNVLVLKANLSHYRPSSRLEFTANDTLEIIIHKYTSTFKAKLTGKMNLLENDIPIEIILDQEQYSYTSSVKMEGLNSFKIAQFGRIFSVKWSDMVNSIVGKALQTEHLVERTLKNFQSISNGTKARLNLIQRRERESQEKYQHKLNVCR